MKSVAITVGNPSSALTLPEWIRWREQETQRMQAELRAVIIAIAERASGVAVH